MKNRLFVGAAVVLTTLALASCKTNKDDYKTCRSDKAVDAELISSVGFVNDTTGVKLDKTEKTGTAYYNIYIAEDAKASLFVYSYDLNDFFASEEGARNKSVLYSTLSFANISVYDSEKTDIMTTFFAKENGIKDVLSDVTFAVSDTTDYQKTIDTTDAYLAYKNGNKISLSIVYMPCYVVHYYDSQKVLTTNLLVPVYATFVTATKEEVAKNGTTTASTISGIRTVDISAYLEGITTVGTMKNTLVEVTE